MPINDSNSTDQFDNSKVVIVGQDNVSVADIKTTSPTSSDSGLVVRNIKQELVTYSCSFNAFTPATNATDICTIRGSGSKKVEIQKIVIDGTRGTHRKDLFTLLKRSTNNTGGTSSVRPVATFDSLNPATTAKVRSYTANPTLGTLVGQIYAQNLSLSVLQPSNAQGNGGASRPFIWAKSEKSQPIVLRGTNEILAINVNSVFPAGAILTITIEWTEE